MKTTDPYAESADRFASDTAGHVMTVLHDDGLYRHLRFRHPEHGAYWFELVTWPGRLAISGDYGDSYVFARLDDMFEFFRSRGGYSINPGYWGEKVISGRDRLATYSMNRFEQLVNETVADHEADYPGLAEAVEAALTDDYNTEYEDGAREFLRDFTYATPDGIKKIAAAQKAWRAAIGSDDSDAKWADYQHVKNRLTFEFTDPPEWNLGDWDWSFLWACHAIRRGIGQYDKTRAQDSPAESEFGVVAVATTGGVL